MPATFTPTTKRGAELAREVLDIIEVEEQRLAEFGRNEDRWEDPDTYMDLVKRTNIWNQGTWGEVWLDKLPADVDVEAIPPDLQDVWGNSMISISGGLSCGTAMCFAGHVVNLAGDRLVVSIGERKVATLRRGKARRNLKRWWTKIRKESPVVEDSMFMGQVLTPDGQLMPVADRAKDLLGLTWMEANRLFDGDNGLVRLRRYVKRMEEGRYVTNGGKKGQRG